jgi:hypothetical protein
MICRMAILRVYVVPNAKTDSVVGEHGGAVKIKLRAPAVEGQANAALVRFLAEQMKLPSACYRAATGSQIARQTDSGRWLEPRRRASPPTRESNRIKGYSVMILSAHSTSETKILGFPNFAPYSFKSVSVTPLAREQAPHA